MRNCATFLALVNAHSLLHCKGRPWDSSCWGDALSLCMDLVRSLVNDSRIGTTSQLALCTMSGVCCSSMAALLL